MQPQGIGGGQREDLSMESDFEADGLSQSSRGNPYGNVGNNSTSPYTRGSYATGSNTYSYDLGNNPNALWNARRAREPISPSQRLLRRPNPYTEIPSLYDMYLQAAARPPAVERFGMQVFENGTRDLQMIPMDLPVGPEYVLGPGDGVSVDLWGGVSRRFYRVVDREGRLSLPEVGPLLVAGKSLRQADRLQAHNHDSARVMVVRLPYLFLQQFRKDIHVRGNPPRQVVRVGLICHAISAEKHIMRIVGVVECHGHAKALPGVVGK